MTVGRKVYLWGGRGRIEWLKRFSHLECLCYIVCLHVSRSKYLCREFGAHCFREKHFVSSQGEEDIWPQGGDRAPGSFVLCSWFCHYSPAGSQRSVKGDTTPGSADEAWFLDRAANKRRKLFNMTNLAFSCLPLHFFFFPLISLVQLCIICLFLSMPHLTHLLTY